MARYSIYLDNNLDRQLTMYMKEHNFTKRSVALKDCINKVILEDDYQSSIYEIDKKLNRILYRLNLNKIILEQLFVNFGFGANEDIDKDEMLNDIYQKNNKYRGRFD